MLCTSLLIYAECSVNAIAMHGQSFIVAGKSAQHVEW